jgi:uncharacterized protein (DUF342 family)
MPFTDNIKLEERGDVLIALCTPPEGGGAAPDLPTLTSLLDERGYARWAHQIEGLHALGLSWSLGGDAFEQAVACREDAHLTVEVAPDGLTAWLSLNAARGGLAPEADDVAHQLVQAGVVYGVDPAALQLVCQSEADVRVVAARGEAAVNGEDTRFELLVNDVRVREPKVDARGLIDYHELGDIPGVQAGQALMRRHPPKPGQRGRDVRATTLHPRPGKDEPFDRPFSGVDVAADDANLLVATQAGQPVHTRCGVVVEQLLVVRGVNMASGNIRFVGSVEVAGDVSVGMTVQASGDIVVKGLVEGAHLDAGGSVRVVGGVIAHATVRAVQSVSVRFVENSALHAGTTIAVETIALHSNLEALNQVLVGVAQGQRGRLIGGSTRATMLVRAHTLGKSTGGLTRVYVGVNAAMLARYEALDKDIVHKHEEADKLEKLIQQLQRQGDPKSLLDKVRAAWQQALKAWARHLEERAELDHEVARAQGAHIETLAGLGGDVDISFGTLTKQLRSGYGAGAFCLDEQGRVVYSPGSNTLAQVV